MISGLRKYLKDRISESSYGFREWKDGFNYENIPRNIFDRCFHIAIDSINSGSNNGGSITDTASVTLRLFFKSKKENQAEIDQALDVAHEIRIRAIDFVKLKQDETIYAVECQTITPEFLLNNDNAIIINMNFSMTSVYRSCL